MILGTGTSLCILGQAGTANFLNILQKLYIDALGIVDPAGGIGTGHRLCAQLPCLLDCVSSNIARTGHSNDLAGKLVAVALEHLLGQVQQAVAGCLLTGKRTAVGQALAGENTLEHSVELAVLTEHIANLTGTNADVAGRHIRVRTDVLIQLIHKALAESHHFPVGLTLGVKVGTALTAAHRQTGQGVLEHLLEAQELEDTQVHRGMETDAALVGTDGTVVLHTVTVVDLHLTLVIHPGYAEHNHTLRGSQPLQQSFTAILFFIHFHHRAQRFQNLFHCLMELRLAGVLLLYAVKNLVYIRHIGYLQIKSYP